MKNKDSHPARMVDEQPNIRDRKKHLLAIIRKNPGLTSRQLTHKYIDKHTRKELKANCNASELFRFMHTQRHAVKYALNKLAGEKEIEEKRIPSPRGGWEKVVWKIS